MDLGHSSRSSFPASGVLSKTSRHNHWNGTMSDGRGYDDGDDVCVVAMTREQPVLPPRLLDAMAVAAGGSDALPVYPASVVPVNLVDDPELITPRLVSLDYVSDAGEGRADWGCHSDNVVKQAELDLCNGRWLSDIAVNMYLAEIWRALDSSMRVHVFNTFFFSQLYSKRIIGEEQLDKVPEIDFLSVQRWTRKTVPLQNQDILLIPVHEHGIHWCLLVVHIPKRQILYCDSVVDHVDYYDEKRAKHLVKALYMWLVLEAVDKRCEERILSGRLCSHSTSASDSAGLHITCSADSHAASQVEAVTAIVAKEGKACCQTYADKCLSRPQNHTDAVAFAEASMQRLSIRSHETGRCVEGNAQSSASACHGWQAVLVSNLAVQQDSDSCGVFMAAFAEMMMRGYVPPYCIHQADIPDIRQGMAAVMKGLPRNVNVTCAAAEDRWAWKIDS